MANCSIVHPCLVFTDKGKGIIAPSEELRKEVGLAVWDVLKEHYSIRKKENKEVEAEARRERKIERSSPELKK